MIKKKLFKIWALLGCSAMFALSGVLLGSLSASSEDNFIQDYYKYGTTFSVPDYSIGDADAVAVVTYPDGTTTNLKEIALNQAGLYTVEYKAVADGKILTEEYSFKVKYPSVTGADASTVYYGTSPYGDAADTPGLFVALDGRDTMTFSQIIDLNGSKKDTYFVELFPTPASAGSSDCEQFWITLTDVENPECFMEIRMNLYTEGTRQTMTLAARSNSQTEVIGLEASTGYIHVGNQYGTYPGVEMNGAVHGIYERNGEINTLKLSYEESTRTLWTSCKWAGMTYKIVDLDDPEFVGDSLWNGFTSGKVRMSFSARGYMSEKANFVFKNVLGADFEAQQEGFEDTTAPTITVQDAVLSPAIGGEFIVPEYSVVDDLSPIVKKEVSVVKSGMPVLVKDGKFKTATAGSYTIVYTAIDSFGNQAQKTVTVVANDGEELILEDVVVKSSYNRGEKVFLPTGNVTGGRGDTALNIYATVNGVKEKLNGNAFIPMEAGVYTLTYEGVDEVGQKIVKEYATTVVNGSNPVFRDEPNLPNYFISTFTYRDPMLYAYDYSSGNEKKIPAELTVSSDSETKKVEFGGGFIPTVKKNLDEITLTWKAGETTLERKVKTVFALSGEGLYTENYFIGDAIVEKGDGYMEFSSLGGNEEWTFLNTLIADSFSLDFLALPNRSNFEAIEFILTDAEDENFGFTVRLSATTEYRSLLTIGRRTALLSGGFHKYSNSNKFMLSYSDCAFSIGSAKIPVDRTDDGRAFNGFPSHTVKLTVKFVNAEKGSAYRVSNLCGQQLGFVYSDRIKPLVKIIGNYGGTCEIGSTITIPKMIARDVLNPSIITYVTVKDADGNFVKAADGTVLQKAPTNKEYMFKAEKYGQYQCEYVASDSLSGRDAKVPFVVTVLETESPIVRFETDPPTSVKVGEVIIIPNLIISDNVSATDKLIISRCIVSSTGKVFHLPEGSNSMKTMHAGVYQIRVLVYDEVGNVAMLRYNVTVTK